MKKRHLAFALLSLCAVLAAAPRIADPDFFLISPWGAANWVHTENRQEVFDDMAACGMTVAGFVDTVEELDMAEKAGLLAWGNPKIPYAHIVRMAMKSRPMPRQSWRASRRPSNTTTTTPHSMDTICGMNRARGHSPI